MPAKTGIAAAWACALLLGAGCEQQREPLPGAEGGSGGEAGISRTPPHPEEPETESGHDFPLKIEGIGSLAELQEALEDIEDPEVAALFESAFRRSFVEDRSLRDYGAARQAVDRVIETRPDFAPAYRVLAYTKLNRGFDMAGATEAYQRAVELDPDYGEAHYALSFMLTQLDMDLGRSHFERAMALGIPDERDLGKRFYP